MASLLDNIFWHALSGPQAHQSSGTSTARRYAEGFSPILAFADPALPDFAALAPYCASGEHFYVGDWSGAMPAGWTLDAEASMFRMVWDGVLPDEDAQLPCRPLGAPDVAQAVALAELTRPGPFGPRTIELGDYFGIFDGDRLVAMAGERAHAPGLREVSGVCTHPDHQGRGWARRLMLKLIRRQLQRGETPFLHVMSTNAGAHGLYLKMGFRDYLEPVVRVVSPG